MAPRSAAPLLPANLFGEPVADEQPAATLPGARAASPASRQQGPREPADATAELSLPAGFVLDKSLSLLKAGEPCCDLVESDNLAVLPALATELGGKVDCIYIDPPYNTGSQGFAYDDRKDAGLQHQCWQDFMRKRLAFVPRLLADDGVIFISIDDNEQARLRLLCDELFGERNFVAQFVWHKTRKGKALSRLARQVTEYVLCYAKDRTVLSKRGLFGMAPLAHLPNPLGHRPNAERELRFPPGVLEVALRDGEHPAQQFGDPNDDSLTVQVRAPFRVERGVVATDFVVYGRFRWIQETLLEQIAEGTRFAVRDGKFRIVFFRDTGHKAPSSLLDDRCGVGTYEEATAEVEALLGGSSFVYPKPVSLVRYLVRAATWNRPHATVMDFFAGTGTTGHAVADLNAADGGSRRTVLVTDNSGRTEGDGAFVADAGDGGICRAIARRRLAAALAGDGAGRPGLPGQLRYFRNP